MKLLDPFSGYRLAQGHVLLHLAYFIAIFILEKEQICTVTDYKGARTFLLVTHMLIFALSFLMNFFSVCLKMTSTTINSYRNSRIVVYFDLISHALEACVLLVY